MPRKGIAWTMGCRFCAKECSDAETDGKGRLFIDSECVLRMSRFPFLSTRGDTLILNPTLFVFFWYHDLGLMRVVPIGYVSLIAMICLYKERDPL